MTTNNWGIPTLIEGVLANAANYNNSLTHVDGVINGRADGTAPNVAGLPGSPNPGEVYIVLEVSNGQVAVADDTGTFQTFTPIERSRLRFGDEIYTFRVDSWVTSQEYDLTEIDYVPNGALNQYTARNLDITLNGFNTFQLVAGPSFTIQPGVTYRLTLRIDSNPSSFYITFDDNGARIANVRFDNEREMCFSWKPTTGNNLVGTITNLSAGVAAAPALTLDVELEA
jgi:hypothetical protein